MELCDIKGHTHTRRKSASLNPKQPHCIQGILTDNLDDIECHAEEWILPTIDTTVPLQRRGSSAGNQHRCMTPSPLVHDIEDYLPCTCHSLSGCTKSSTSAECTERGTPFIPIPKRLRNRRSLNIEIIRRMADRDFEISSAGIALVKMPAYNKSNDSSPSSAIDTTNSELPSLFSSSGSSSPSPKIPRRYSVLMAEEMETRVHRKQLMEYLDNESVQGALTTSKEMLRRLDWARDMMEMFPDECIRDFT